MTTYKQVAVYKEQQLRKENNRLKVLLNNTLVMLEDVGHINTKDDRCELLKEIGMTTKEYEDITGEPLL